MPSSCLVLKHYLNQCWLLPQKKKTTLNFESKCNIYLSRKCIWRCLLQNVSHFFMFRCVNVWLKKDQYALIPVIMTIRPHTGDRTHMDSQDNISSRNKELARGFSTKLLTCFCCFLSTYNEILHMPRHCYSHMRLWQCHCMCNISYQENGHISMFR